MHLKQSLFATASAVLLIATNAQAQEAETERESAIDRVLGTVTVTATVCVGVCDAVLSQSAKPSDRTVCCYRAYRLYGGRGETVAS